MSYILDALKKSDQERQKNSGPSLQTIQRPHRLDRQGNGMTGPLLGFCCAAVLFGLAAWWYLNQSSATVEPQAKVAVRAGTDAPGPASEMIKPPVTDSETTVAGSPTATAPDTTVITASGNTPLVQPATVSFDELPDHIRSAIPALTFSFHVYSDNPQRRTIIINKRRVKEGNSVDGRLILQEITREGVVLDWDGHRFYINVVESW